MIDYRPETLHAALGEGFFDPVRAATFPRTLLRYRNQRWADAVGLGGLDDDAWLAHFGRFEPLPGSFAEPLALRYHGHQFRVYNPDLGDGRGFLFAQLRDRAGRLLDLGTKGSGRTPYSRGADGRLTLKGGVREALATAMLEAQGVYTSKTFSLIETGEALQRNDEPSPTRAAVLVRLSHGHIRIGTFQRLAAEGDDTRIERLVRHCLAHYPDPARPVAPDAPIADAALSFFASVAARVGRLGAQWMAAGFVHGVLNTDNIVITGESFDYGPWRWLPTFDPNFTAAYFDHAGLYAFGRQPGALKWNLARLAECLLPFVGVEALEPALDGFDAAFHEGLSAAVLARLGLATRGEAADEALVGALFGFMRESGAPFEGVMFDCAGGLPRLAERGSGPRGAFYAGEPFEALRRALAGYEADGRLDLAGPHFSGEDPVTMTHDVSEAIWAPIARDDDWSAFHSALRAIEGMRRAGASTG
jgi:uncharacterized protein YdiU (UPF0061 family)